MSSGANFFAVPGSVAASGLQQAASAPAAEVAGERAGAAAQPVGAKGGKLVAFEGFLKKAGKMAGVVLADIVKYVVPIAAIVSVVEPETAPVIGAFVASVKLVQSTVIAAQQRWISEGPAANGQKLADVLAIVEQPIVTMFAQAGIEVDTGYVVNLVNGVVAILNAQPATMLPSRGV